MGVGGGGVIRQCGHHCALSTLWKQPQGMPTLEKVIGAAPGRSEPPHPSLVLGTYVLPIPPPHSGSHFWEWKLESLSYCWGHLDGICDWTQFRPLYKHGRFWQAGAEINSPWDHPRQAVCVSPLAYETCQSGVACLFLQSLLVRPVQGRLWDLTSSSPALRKAKQTQEVPWVKDEGGWRRKQGQWASHLNPGPSLRTVRERGGNTLKVEDSLMGDGLGTGFRSQKVWVGQGINWVITLNPSFCLSCVELHRDDK